MASNVKTRYVLAERREVERDGRYVEIQPVLKQVVMYDGQITFVKQEKVMADTFEEFREQFPNIEVVGVPTSDELARAAVSMTDEQLAELGLARASDQLETRGSDLFASAAARELAEDEGLSVQTITHSEIEGSGQDGRLTTSDVRAIVAEIEATEE